MIDLYYGGEFKIDLLLNTKSGNDVLTVRFLLDKVTQFVLDALQL
jgi:hypothetical protein